MKVSISVITGLALLCSAFGAVTTRTGDLASARGLGSSSKSADIRTVDDITYPSTASLLSAAVGDDAEHGVDDVGAVQPLEPEPVQGTRPLARIGANAKALKKKLLLKKKKKLLLKKKFPTFCTCRRTHGPPGVCFDFVESTHYKPSRRHRYCERRRCTPKYECVSPKFGKKKGSSVCIKRVSKTKIVRLRKKGYNGKKLLCRSINTPKMIFYVPYSGEERS